MISLLTSEINSYVIKNFFQKNENDFPNVTFRKDYTNSIKEYMSKARSLNHLEYVIIDLSILTDNQIDLIRSLIKLRSQLPNTRIIILALNVMYSDSVITELIKNQFFNIIIGENEYIIETNIRNCFSEDGMKYSQISKYIKSKSEQNFLQKCKDRIKFYIERKKRKRISEIEEINIDESTEHDEQDNNLYDEYNFDENYNTLEEPVDEEYGEEFEDEELSPAMSLYGFDED